METRVVTNCRVNDNKESSSSLLSLSLLSSISSRVCKSEQPSEQTDRTQENISFIGSDDDDDNDDDDTTTVLESSSSSCGGGIILKDGSSILVAMVSNKSSASWATVMADE